MAAPRQKPAVPRTASKPSRNGDQTATDRTAGGQFGPGNTFGRGRPAGARNRLGEQFVDALCQDFERHGTKVIEQVRTEDPTGYLRTIARVIPAKVEIFDGGPLAKLSDAELAQQRDQLWRELSGK